MLAEVHALELAAVIQLKKVGELHVIGQRDRDGLQGSAVLHEVWPGKAADGERDLRM